MLHVIYSLTSLLLANNRGALGNVALEFPPTKGHDSEDWHRKDKDLVAGTGIANGEGSYHPARKGGSGSIDTTQAIMGSGYFEGW